jgi:hypothetical protein
VLGKKEFKVLEDGVQVTGHLANCRMECAARQWTRSGRKKLSESQERQNQWQRFRENLVSAHVQTEFCGEISVISERLGLFTINLAIYWKAVVLEWMGALRWWDGFSIKPYCGELVELFPVHSRFYL